MFYKQQGLPEESELVLCTIKKVLFHSVFVTLDEYENLEGMIHISEISPGRIRNMRDFVIEGKKIICKVIKVNKEKRQIDLSLRRVSSSMKKSKSAEYKQQQKAEKIMELAAKELNTNLADMYKKIGYRLIEKYESLDNCFQKVLHDEINLTKEEYGPILTKTIKEKIKLPSIRTNQKIALSTNYKDGINKIKSIFQKTKKFCEEKKHDVKFTYISAPKYNISLTTKDYKIAEKEMKEITTFILTAAKNNQVKGELLK